MQVLQPLRRIFVCCLACAACAAANGADFPDLIDRIKPSVVAVGTFKATDSPPFTLRGTGFVVSDGNSAATNAHVVGDLADSAIAAALAVQFKANGQTHVRRARVTANAPEYDLAVLQFEGAPLVPLVLADSNRVREGEAVGFTGFPIGGLLGFSPVTHRGSISSITPIALPGARAQQLNEKLIRRLRSGTFNIFQLDATAYPGNSGSPVFNAATGEVVGIINMVLVKGTREAALSHPSGIAYAIPANFLQEMLRPGK